MVEQEQQEVVSREVGIFGASICVLTDFRLEYATVRKVLRELETHWNEFRRRFFCLEGPGGLGRIRRKGAGGSGQLGAVFSQPMEDVGCLDESSGKIQKKTEVDSV